MNFAKRLNERGFTMHRLEAVDHSRSACIKSFLAAYLFVLPLSKPRMGRSCKLPLVHEQRTAYP